MNVYIVKTNDNQFIIGDGGKTKAGFRLKVPFEMKMTDQGVTLTPFDVETIDTYIPFIDFQEYMYEVQPEKALADFYENASSGFVKEVKERIASGLSPGAVLTQEEIDATVVSETSVQE